VRRRELITLFAGAMAWPITAQAQKPGVRVIGFLSLGSAAQTQGQLRAFRQGLAEAGYAAEQSVAIEFRSANNEAQLLPRLAADLVQRQVDVIVTTGSPYAAVAAKQATSTIPIVFAMTEDPMKYGLVTSYSRPGSNLTGMNFLTSELAGKRLDLLVKLIPEASKIGFLSAPSGSPVFEEMRSDALAAGRALDREIVIVAVQRLDFEAAFAALIRQQARALTVGSFTLLYNNREKIVQLAARHKIPTIYPNRFFVVSGGLMSYDSDASDAFRKVLPHYVAQILKGAKPGDLPVQQPTRFSFVINLKTSKALGVTIPPGLLAIADEVIE
jgi:putative ABC transport system substrate-binding protein